MAGLGAKSTAPQSGETRKTELERIERCATAILDAWNAEYRLNPDVMTQAGESFKRRFYAEVTIDTLLAEGWTPPGNEGDSDGSVS